MRMHPVKKRKIFHAGIDIAVPYGTPVYASGGGEVTEARYSSSYGWHIKIRHQGGFSTLYAHLSKLHVRKGSYVRMGQHIGGVGRTDCNRIPPAFRSEKERYSGKSVAMDITDTIKKETLI